MRFSTDDGMFALIITPSRERHSADFFRFQFVIAGEVVGDEQPGILGSAMSFLAEVPQIEDPRLAHPEADPGGTLTVAITDDTVELRTHHG